jgi:hypothetical protein
MMVAVMPTVPERWHLQALMARADRSLPPRYGSCVVSGNERGVRFDRPLIPSGGGGTPHRKSSGRSVLGPKAAELGDVVGRHLGTPDVLPA